MTTIPRRISPGPAWPLMGVAATRRLEQAAFTVTAPHALMQRAGLASARLAMALAPHAGTIWIAAGPGNNGGDGIEAALHLRQWGKAVVVTRIGNTGNGPADAMAACERASQAGIAFAQAVPEHWDLAIDALLGIGASRPPEGQIAQWITRMNASVAPVLSIDIPTGLDADTGVAAPVCARALASLCLLTLKPGLFTAQGRDASTQVWLDDLGVGDMVAPGQDLPVEPDAWLLAQPPSQPRAHATHKGSFGDVAIVGGAPGMTGAALLAASAALHSGAGRVFVCLLGEGPSGPLPDHPETMLRNVGQIDLAQTTVVCGCGGGDLVRGPLPRLLSQAARLVVDADALNAIASDRSLQQLLQARAQRQLPTVLTPHPLEAARLLATTSAQVQADRLASARELAQRFACTVVLKGSGSIVASPGELPLVNPTGNARLAAAGTGDVLAGAIGASLAAGESARDAAGRAVYLHGLAADRWPASETLTASGLARAIR